MFSQIFGKFLVEQNKISGDSMSKALELQQSARAKLGLIAVSEKLITIEQADMINRRQALEDKRFGDIAVELGILTESQVSHILGLQGNPYLVFVQTLTEQGFLSSEEIETELRSYQESLKFSDADMEALKSGDPDRIISLFIQCENPYAKELAAVAVRLILRLIDNQIALASSYQTCTCTCENISLQRINGEHTFLLGLSGTGTNLLTIADTYAKETFEAMDEDSFDAVCEFANNINGLFASSLSEKGITLEMLPPEYVQNSSLQSDGQLLIVPVFIQNKEIQIVVAADTEVRVNS